MGGGKQPGCLMGARDPRNPDIFMWAAFASNPADPGSSDDLTRRGGEVGQAAKDDALATFSNAGAFVQAVLGATPPEKLTRVGMVDRKNLELPFVSPSKRVALLGDAAHPQTPFLGQGVNMALCDAVVAALRLAHQPVEAALAGYACEIRRMQAKKTVIDARTWADLSCSRNAIKCWVFRMLSKYLPPKLILGDILRSDQSNVDFLDRTLKELGVGLPETSEEKTRP